MSERNRFIKLEITAGDVMCDSCEFADNNMQMCTIFLESIKIGRTKDCLDGEIKPFTEPRVREVREEEAKEPEEVKEEVV
jgi:hypothetical protein